LLAPYVRAQHAAALDRAGIDDVDLARQGWTKAVMALLL